MEELGAVIRNLLERSQIMESEWRYKNRQLQEKQAQLKNTLTQPQLPEVPAPNPPPELTAREKQVLELLAQGLSNVEIGHQLHLSPRTVEKYVSSLLRKTETNNRAELVRFALEHHLVD
jgi:DNA-binding NarL/FixJ family response regulator